MPRVASREGMHGRDDGEYRLVLGNPYSTSWEEQVHVTIANPEHVKALRGKKTDRKDCRWLAGLLRHGLVQPSFIPPRDIRELRDLTRRRRTLLQNGVEERNRVLKILEDANVKIGSVLSDVFGISGRQLGSVIRK